MKRNFISLLSITLLSLVGCGGGSSTGLKYDKRSNYSFDEVSNEDGSMSYEIFVRSFYDHDGDGIGDLLGVKDKLPYIADLGIKTIWLMPIHKSPSYHGYDVSDYYSIHPEYGTLEDFDSLVEEANKYNIDIMIDMVLNHCSRENRYFLKSYEDYLDNNTSSTSYADWFKWSDKPIGSGYNIYNGVYYESRFDASMPDFNLDNEAVRNEIENICEFWIKEHGVKGFRLDAVLYYYYMDTEKNVEFLSWLDGVTKKYNKDFYMVGECWDSDTVVSQYYQSKCESFFKFTSGLTGSSEPNASITNLSKGYLKSSRFLTNIANYEKKIHANNPNGYSSYFLANHDNDRPSISLSDVNAKVAASIYGLLPGTPFMYYGEEIELKGLRKSSDYSDARRRLPMIWSKDDKTGETVFPERNRQDLNNNDQVEEGVNDKLKEGYSLLNHYKKVINVRNKYPIFKHGIFSSMYNELELDNDYIVAYKISLNDDYIVVITNVGEENATINVKEMEIQDEINTSRLIPQIKNGILEIAPKSTVLLK